LPWGKQIALVPALLSGRRRARLMRAASHAALREQLRL
jgi:hypothetical protein